MKRYLHLQKLEDQLPEVALTWFRRFYREQAERLRSPLAKRTVLDFLHFQRRHGLAVSELSQGFLEEYLADQAERFPNRNTQNMYRSNLRLWLRFLYRERLLLQAWHELLPDRAFRLEVGRKPLTYPQIEQIMKAPDLKTPRGLLARAVLELCYGCALRKGELLDLELGDVDFAESSLTIRIAKNGTGRVLPLPGAARHFLRRYLQEVRPLWAKGGAYFFVDRHGCRLSGSSMVKFLLKRPPFPFCMHQLRHSCATHLLAAGVDVVYIKEFLGHIKINSTQRYTQLTPLEVQKMQRNCHPLDTFDGSCQGV